MKRRDFMSHSACFGVVVATTPLNSLAFSSNKLTPPAKGKIPVAFAISEGATVIDFAGPWEVFQDVHVQTRGSNMDEQMPFQLYTVSGNTEPITGSGGL
ncbi:MAG TPA: hypothetical protein VFT08_07185, partial [Pyrinomonadaceae bacterium]|nr:hypothetical protein [Pyrinomonadaceae bacterium]